MLTPEQKKIADDFVKSLIAEQGAKNTSSLQNSRDETNAARMLIKAGFSAVEARKELVSVYGDTLHVIRAINKVYGDK